MHTVSGAAARYGPITQAPRLPVSSSFMGVLVVLYGLAQHRAVSGATVVFPGSLSSISMLVVDRFGWAVDTQRERESGMYVYCLQIC